MDEQTLVKAAIAAREAAYAPYSGFSVGAALLTRGEKLFTGCNIENASSPAGNCAERTAFFKAVSAGERKFAAIAVVGGRAGKPICGACPPCGICRQVMAEFCDPASFLILLPESPEKWSVHTLGELLPLGFGHGNLV
jgi:cytidine deaminase